MIVESSGQTSPSGRRIFRICMTLLKRGAPLQAQLFGLKDNYTAPNGLLPSVYPLEPKYISVVSGFIDFEG